MIFSSNELKVYILSNIKSHTMYITKFYLLFDRQDYASHDFLR